jgi:hypothetical protein
LRADENVRGGNFHDAQPHGDAELGEGDLRRMPEGEDVKSRSEMKRIAIQNPDALIAEIERLRAAYAVLDSSHSEFKTENARLREVLEACRTQYEDFYGKQPHGPLYQKISVALEAKP